MNATSEDIGDILIADSSLGLSIGQNLFIGREPVNPNASVTVLDAGGYAPQLTYTKGEDYYYPSVQIIVRNTDYRTAYNLAHDIEVLLHGEAQITINNTFYSLIRSLHSPALLGWDDQGRCRLSLNFNIQRR